MERKREIFPEMIEKLSAALREAFLKRYGEDPGEIALNTPPDLRFGDLASAAPLEMAKKLKFIVTSPDSGLTFDQFPDRYVFNRYQPGPNVLLVVRIDHTCHIKDVLHCLEPKRDSSG